MKNLILTIWRRSWRLIQRFFWLTGWFFGVGLLSLFPIRWISGDHFYLTRLAGYILPWLLILSVPVLLIAWWARRRWLLAVWTIPTILIVFSFAPLFWPNSPRPDNGPDSFPLKIVSHNMFRGKDKAAIIALMRRENPDVLLLQEFNPALGSMAFRDLADIYPELSIEVVDQAQAGFSAAVLSRYPITWAGADYDKGRTQKVRIETPAGPIEIWNVHPFPPYIMDSERQDRQLVALATDIAAVRGPLIVAGDFNITDQSETYALFRRHLRNAHEDAGWGFGFTFPALPHSKGLPFAPGPLYRIDHIFFSEHFVARRARTLSPIGASDHLPIVAELSLAGSFDRVSR